MKYIKFFEQMKKNWDRLEKNWDNFIDDCENQKGCKKIIIKAGEHLSDKINELI